MARADSKKRKRISDSVLLPPTKQFRSSPPPPPPNLATDAPILNHHAHMILEILEMIDTQGLLDRVFPVAHHSTWLSLRNILQQFNHHPLQVLRSAVHHLLPLSRASQSPTAAQQLCFCNLALSLLDQASFHNVPLSLSLSSILQQQQQQQTPVVSKRKYALLQHLPTGDYWSSLSSDSIKDLQPANAELVAILPTPLDPSSSKHVPSLGSYKPPKSLPPPKPIPPQRRVTTCDFLDYGLWSSFAPAFDHDAQIVGPTELGQVVYGWQQRRRGKIPQCREQPEGTGIIQDILTDTTTQDVETELEELLPPDQAQHMKTALATLQLEDAIHELLERNRLALLRLEELQRFRLLADGGGSSVPLEGSEEWDTAQGILDSLTVLASLRPRAIPLDPALQDDESSSILPPPSVLHKLHQTLALESSPGWHGTLPPTRTTALRDDNTIKVRSGIALPTAPTPAAAAAVPTTTTAITATPIPVTTTPAGMTATPYTGYTYQYGATPQPQQQAYRPTGTGTPAPIPTVAAAAAAAAAAAYSAYKPPYYQYAPPQQGIQQSYYGHQQQGYGAAQFSGGWYNAYAGTVNLAANMSPVPVPVAQSGSGSAGRGTPQPPTQQGQVPAIPAANGPTTYGAFFGAAQGPPPLPAGGGGAVKMPVVANTVSYAGAQVGSGGGGAVPTLPVHLRSGQHFQQPLQQGSYYGAYQPPVAR